MAKKKIAVNTRLLLEGKMDGIGWFTYETFKRIVQRHPEHEFHFFFDRPYSSKFVFADNVIPHIVHPQARHTLLFKVWYDYSVPFVLKRIKPDVFISPDAMMSLRTDVPQMIVMHDLNFVHYPNDLSKRVANYLIDGSKKFAALADRIVTVSEFSKNDIIKQYGVPADKVDNVYNGVNESFQPLTPQTIANTRFKLTQGQPYFLFVGSAYPRKNLQRLLPAFELFKERTGSNVKLVIVGKTFSAYPAVNEVYQKMKYASDVVFTGMLDAEQLHQVIGSALASVYVSYFEGFGIPILEAFKCDVPVITSNITSMPEVAGDAALLVDPFSVDDIAHAMTRIYNEETLREELMRKGRERVQLFSWDATADKLWQSIEKLWE
jgi:glycosyltransferase involved in cell wall biosynthesis